MEDHTVTEILLCAAQVLTGRAGERIQDGAVLIRDGGIVAIGPANQVEGAASGEVERRTFADATILPGLIDCHVHLAFDASADFVARLQATSDTDLADQMADRAARLLRSGVTTARDLGDRGGQAARLRDAIAAGRLPGPRLLAAGAPLTRPGGHCWFLGGEVDSPASIREQIRTNVTGGADVVKVMVTGGHVTPGGAAMWESQFDLDDLRLVVEEAHRHGLPVAAHVHGTQGIADAVQAGVSTLEHCSWLGPTGPAPAPPVRDQIIDKGIFVCPAVSRNWRGFPQRFGPEFTAVLFDQLRQAEQRGMRLAAGTDSGIPGAIFGDYVGALQLFAHLGIPADRIVELATAAAAEALGLADVTGRLAAGMAADVLVVAGDPLTRLDALREVLLVVARGAQHPTNA